MDIHGKLVFEQDLTLSDDSEVGYLGEVGAPTSISTDDLIPIDVHDSGGKHYEYSNAIL